MDPHSLASKHDAPLIPPSRSIMARGKSQGCTHNLFNLWKSFGYLDLECVNGTVNSVRNLWHDYGRNCPLFFRLFWSVDFSLASGNGLIGVDEWVEWR